MQLPVSLCGEAEPGAQRGPSATAGPSPVTQWPVAGQEEGPRLGSRQVGRRQ